MGLGKSTALSLGHRTSRRIKQGKRRSIAGLSLGALDTQDRKQNQKNHLTLDALLTQGKHAVKVTAMIDSGATGLFIDKEFAAHLGLKLVK